ncbi:MAG TPA: cupin domain-containing protein [Actinomycetota bacterium]|nr:cupin domain-containing protein [Actinomycetota bacterium]
MTTRAEAIAALEDEGLTVTEWHDEPGTHYPEHAHSRNEVLFVLDGSITIVAGERTRTLGPGDRTGLPAGEKHTATVGPDGVHYLLGKL